MVGACVAFIRRSAWKGANNREGGGRGWAGRNSGGYLGVGQAGALDKPGGSPCKSKKQARHPQESQEDQTTLALRISNNAHLPAVTL